MGGEKQDRAIAVESLERTDNDAFQHLKGANGATPGSSENILWKHPWTKPPSNPGLRFEFENAFTALEQAPEAEKPRAASRLNRAVRRLYDLIGYGKMPANGYALRGGE